jgi:hypothetical protein
VTFYYSDSNEKQEDFWNLRAKRFDTRLKTFIGNRTAIREAIATMAIPPGASLPDKLQAAYAWIEQNITNTSLLSAEQEEALDDSEEKNAYDSKSVLRARRANSYEIDFLFAGFARELGADANLVRATDRTDHFWNKGLKSLDQFDYTFVAVRATGEPDESIVVVDAGSGLPYGQVPWRATGANALLCTREGAQTYVVPPAVAKLNLSDTKVTIEFGEENETILAKWYRRASGAAGMDHRRWFRDLDPSKRKKTLDDFCGGHAIEVLGAELPEIAASSGPFQVACDLDLGESHISDDTGRYSFAFTGPWWPVTPEFPSSNRTTPVIFQYQLADVVSIDVKAPRGFRAASAPAPIDLRSPFGRYQLAIVKNEEGFHVDRALALLPLKVDPPDYAALRSFLQDVAKHDHTSLLFERGLGQDR